MNKTSDFNQQASVSAGNQQKEERLPHCQRCAQHRVRNRLRGHKSTCPFRHCQCAKCIIVVERQRLMADQIKLRRQQKKQRSLHRIQVAIEEINNKTNEQNLEGHHPKEEQQRQLFANFLGGQQQHLSLFGGFKSLFNQC